MQVFFNNTTKEIRDGISKYKTNYDNTKNLENSEDSN